MSFLVLAAICLIVGISVYAAYCRQAERHKRDQMKLDKWFHKYTDLS